MSGSLVFAVVAAVTSAPPPSAPVEETRALVPSGFVEMFVATVMPTADGHTVVLVNPDEEVLLPVGVALPEAVTIYGRLEHKRAPRPLTHDLLDGVITSLGARIVRVQIDDLVDGAFIGRVVLQGRTGGAISLDARAADALAVALSAKAPIFVARPVMDRAALTRDDLKAMPTPTSPPSPTAEGTLRTFEL